jgi:hypothetical protein
MKRRTRWIAGLSAVLLTVMMAATAFAYGDWVVKSVTVAVHGTVTCDAPFTLTATIVDTNGTPVSGQSVVWSFVTAPSTSDRISKTPTITNSHGVATTTVTLAPVSGTRRIRATAGDVSASAVVSASCGGGVLPSTSTLPAETAPGQTAPLLAMLLAMAFATGGGLTLRRLASTRS